MKVPPIGILKVSPWLRKGESLWLTSAWPRGLELLAAGRGWWWVRGWEEGNIVQTAEKREAGWPCSPGVVSTKEPWAPGSPAPSPLTSPRTERLHSPSPLWDVAPCYQACLELFEKQKHASAMLGYCCSTAVAAVTTLRQGQATVGGKPGLSLCRAAGSSSPVTGEAWKRLSIWSAVTKVNAGHLQDLHLEITLLIVHLLESLGAPSPSWLSRQRQGLAQAPPASESPAGKTDGRPPHEVPLCSDCT